MLPAVAAPMVRSVRRWWTYVCGWWKREYLREQIDPRGRFVHFFLGFRMGTHDDIYNGTRRRIFAQFYFNFFFFCIHQQPETIPQASINMSDVIEVADAEQITGHTNSILIQTPDCSTFVKGTCQEESKWWCNVLVQLVKSKVRHHKRNAFLKGQNQKCEFHFVFDWSASRSPRCGEERELCGNWVT